MKFSNWKLMIFGLALILVMRFRPHGILPESREKTDRPTPPDPLTPANLIA